MVNNLVPLSTQRGWIRSSTSKHFVVEYMRVKKLRIFVIQMRLVKIQNCRVHMPVTALNLITVTEKHVLYQCNKNGSKRFGVLFWGELTRRNQILKWFQSSFIEKRSNIGNIKGQKHQGHPTVNFTNVNYCYPVQVRGMFITFSSMLSLCVLWTKRYIVEGVQNHTDLRVNFYSQLDLGIFMLQLTPVVFLQIMNCEPGTVGYG